MARCSRRCSDAEKGRTAKASTATTDPGIGEEANKSTKTQAAWVDFTTDHPPHCEHPGAVVWFGVIQRRWVQLGTVRTSTLPPGVWMVHDDGRARRRRCMYWFANSLPPLPPFRLLKGRPLRSSSWDNANRVRVPERTARTDRRERYASERGERERERENWDGKPGTFRGRGAAEGRERVAGTAVISGRL
jgi:hypothetical protein